MTHIVGRIVFILWILSNEVLPVFGQNSGTPLNGIVYPPITEREGKGLTIPMPPDEHPRLFLRQKDVASLKTRLEDPLLKICRDKIYSASLHEGNGSAETGKSGNDVSIRNAIEAKALLWLLNEDREMGRTAVELALRYFEKLHIDHRAPDVTREIGRAVVTGSIVYDWCYALLTEKEKLALAKEMEALATKMEIGWPLIKGSSMTGHTVEAQLSRDMLALGIAVFNENPEIYKRVAGRIFAEFVEARKFYYPGAYHHQGSAYGAYRFGWEMVATLIFDRMGYPDLYGREQSQVPYYFIYNRRPDGQLIRDGDDYNEQSAQFGKWWVLGQGVHFLAGSYHKDAVVLKEAFKERALGESSDYLFDFLFVEPRITEVKSRAGLPLTRYFKEPYGAMTARTGWQDGIGSNTVVAQMKIGTYNFANHQHLDAGSFQLYYKGPLSVQSGIYQGVNGGYGSEHFKNYSQRSIAHNTLLVRDPDEKFGWHGQVVANDGGQRFPANASEPQNMSALLGGEYKTGSVLAHAFGPDSISPDFSYLKGDITGAYSAKVKSVQRSYVFLNLNNTVSPAVLIVFDKVISQNKDFKKTWLLHGVEEPVIDRVQSTFARTEKGYSGKMINTTLIPSVENLSIIKVGGPGHEFEVNGKNYPQQFSKPASASGDSAVWRIEVSPKMAELENTFLNVMQVMDKDAISELPQKIETVQLTGASINDRVVLFSKTGELVTKPIELALTGRGEFKVLILDVPDGTWTVRNRGKASKGRQIKNTSQLLYFTLKAGKYTISKNE